MKEQEINIDDEELKDEPASEGEAPASEEGKEEAEKENEAETAEERDPLDVALEEIESLKDKYLRQAAEFDNYRKRTLKERAELILNGGEKTIKAILPVVDDMERALKNGDKTDDPQVLREGMELIYNKMMKTLESLGVAKIDTEGADFDTDLHDAEALVPGMGDEMKGKVIDCLSTGYKLNDKVIRHAKVAVGQ
ncbi:MAG: nucleotide exchange factor GrpE [Prevotella sp.]|nr:nucleotide exchange factor GrpE [Prevotella sp.]